jgi:hypothetical protein
MKALSPSTSTAKKKKKETILLNSTMQIRGKSGSASRKETGSMRRCFEQES